MFLIHIKEFGSATEAVSCSPGLMYKNGYEILSGNENVLYFLPDNLVSFTFSYDGLWVILRGENNLTTSLRLTYDGWEIDCTRPYRFDGNTPSVDDMYFVVDGRFEDTSISSINSDGAVINRISMENIYKSLISIEQYLYVKNAYETIFCLDKNLTTVWSNASGKRNNSANNKTTNLMAYQKLIISNCGEDTTDARGNFQINAYQYHTGDLVWQQIVETSPNMSSLVGDKLYVCVKNRFRRIDALTGEVEVNEEFDYKSFDGKIGEIGGVYPIKDGLLCSNKNNSYVELRTFDAKTILQTIRLPETYCFSGKEPPVEFEDKLYLNLTHVMPIPFNFMKSGIAVLTPNADAPANVEATLEARPPYTVEAAKDDAGNNAHLVRIGGNDEKKILRYSQVILKEIAVKTGVAWGWEFEEHDKKHAGKLYLEIDTKDLAPVDRTKEEWLEYFKVIKTRVDDELFSNKVIAGNGKHRYRVLLSIA